LCCIIQVCPVFVLADGTQDLFCEEIPQAQKFHVKKSNKLQSLLAFIFPHHKQISYVTFSIFPTIYGIYSGYLPQHPERCSKSDYMELRLVVSFSIPTTVRSLSALSRMVRISYNPYSHSIALRTKPQFTNIVFLDLPHSIVLLK